MPKPSGREMLPRRSTDYSKLCNVLFQFVPYMYARFVVVCVTRYFLVFPVIFLIQMIFMVGLVNENQFDS
jgi:hypothetical protein